jgi:hypothetical protein
MSLEEARILPNDIHDVRGNDGLVIFPALDFTKAKEILDDGDQKSFFGFLICGIVSSERHRRYEHILMAPEIEPIAQQRVLRFCQDHSEPSTCFASFSVRIVSVSVTSK